MATKLDNEANPLSSMLTVFIAKEEIDPFVFIGDEANGI